jgi:hypothetical protein
VFKLGLAPIEIGTGAIVVVADDVVVGVAGVVVD